MQITFFCNYLAWSKVDYKKRRATPLFAMSKAHLKRGAFATVVKAPTFLFLLLARQSLIGVERRGLGMSKTKK